MRIVFFDGHCNLCNGFVGWLLRADEAGALKVASLQGETARGLLGAVRERGDPDSVVYLREGKKYERSGAVIRVLTDLGGWHALAGAAWVIPAPLRDLLYRALARNRYRLFGRRETCRLPTDSERSRFLP